MRPVLLLVGFLACTPGPVAEECTVKVAAARTLFAHGGDPVVVQALPGMQLAESSSAGSIEDGIPVFVRADGSFVLDHKTSLPTPAAAHALLQEEFDRATALAENTGRPWVQRLLIVADARAPASAILDLAALVPPTMKLIVVVDLAGDVVPLAPPMPDTVKAVLDLPTEQRSGKLADILIPAMGSCTALHEVFDAVATTSPDLRGKVLYEGLPTAIEKCKCQGVDVDTLVSATWAMGGKTQANKRGLVLPLSREPDGEAVELPVDAKTTDLVRLAEARAGKPFHVTRKP